MTIPAPSLITNPSRSASNGREARSGSSLRVDRARMAEKPPTHSGAITPSHPPAIMTSASLRAVADRNLTRGHVHDESDDEEGRHAPRPLAQQDGVLPLDGREPADSRADVHPD